jgi:uncharacterized protein (TIGR00299 family) protein
MPTPEIPLLFVDPFAGASGDMLLGALVDLGYPFTRLRRDVAALGLEGVTLSRRRVTRGGLSATRIVVRCAPDQPHRGRREIRRLLRTAPLEPAVRRRAMEVFEALIAAEARLHRMPPERVHLHEVGALDALADVVGTVAALFGLGVREMVCGPINVGSGTVACAHGRLPVPAPATAELLKGLPITSLGEGERTTPTGAALLRVLTTACGPLPPALIEHTGHGAGARDTKDLPNLLRLLGGRRAGAATDGGEALVELSSQIDDMDPRLYGHLLERLLAAGALDVAVLPATVKKGRPGSLLLVLAEPDRAGALGRLIFDETPTLGYRLSPVRRVSRARRQVAVDTPWGQVRMKVADDAAGAPVATPEYEDCRALARRRGIPLREVMAAAAAAWAAGAGRRRRR